MHFSAALTTLSAFALMSTTLAVPRSASFTTWGNNTTCNGEEQYTRRYEGKDDTQPCMDLPFALAGSIVVDYTRLPSCRVNTFSGAGCTGDVTSYEKLNGGNPCRPLTGKVSYNITC